MAYINLVIEHVATVKGAQALAWHATPDLTMNVYGGPATSGWRRGWSSYPKRYSP